MSGGENVVGGVQPSGANGPQGAQKAHQTEQAELEAEAASEEMEALEDLAENVIFSPFNKQAKKLQERLKQKAAESGKAEKEEEIEDQLVDDVTRLAKSLEEKNPEMNPRALLGMRAGIKETDDAETILEKVRAFYKDEYLADEALKFLEATTNPHTNLGKNVRLATALLNDRFGREVRAGRNINDTAQAYAKEGLATTGSLRDLYREVTGDPKDPATLFDQLSSAFNFEKLKSVMSFLLHSLGQDMKSKGPSISKLELSRLFAETRTMQAILGIYKFFKSRMNLMKESFARENLRFPQKITFEVLAKLFTKYIQERYPSPDKVLRDARELGIDAELIAQIIVFTQYRDAIRNVSPKIFRSIKHRQDLLMALIETISELDDLLEEEYDEDEEEEDLPNQTGWQQEDTIE
ncbi:type III secretion system gatekeeper subunit SctW [bacterium]|nr:type III secretion system gatekeeper subunit SctW [bacterium]